MYKTTVRTADYASSTVSNVYDWIDSPNGEAPHALVPQSFDKIERSAHPGDCKDVGSAYRTTLRLALAGSHRVAHTASTRNVARCWPIVKKRRPWLY